MQISVVEKKLLSVKETAKLLNISERSLWSTTAPRGRLVSCRIGGRVLYSPQAIERFIEEQMERRDDNSLN